MLNHENAERLPYRQAEERPAVDPVAGEELHVLQTNELKFAGQPIAVVVAETQAQVEYGASLVRAVNSAGSTSRTRFDPALARPTSEAAAEKGRGSESIQGDPEGAFSRAAVKIEQRCLQAREQPNGVELYRDRPMDAWPRTAVGELKMKTEPLDLRALLNDN